jgi:MoaA/NifB/PqqE/SkfB family radical SAM enzyme
MVTSKPSLWGEVDADGRLVLPPEVAAARGLVPGARVRLDPDGNHIRLHRPVTHLTKVYVEPTIQCNLDCVTCIRHNWEGTTGRMSDEAFAQVLAGLRDFSPLPTVFFGGLGEPLFHRRTVAWVAQAKAAGARVELITNGTLLTEKRSRQLIEAGLDVLWVSLDGATPASYADVRLGAELPQVVANVQQFRRMRRGSHYPTPQIGIAFVAMTRNIHELPQVLALGRRLGASLFSVSNVLPYTAEMQADRLYAGTIRNMAYLSALHLPKLNLPKMDLNEVTQAAFQAALNSGYSVNFAGNSLAGANDVCGFVESGTLSVAWDGGVSPCWPLMHTHTSYLHGKPRHSRRHVVGWLGQRSLADIWNDPEYVGYRERVQSFAFAPCTFCGGCELAEANEEDCLGNTFPACGGCLWAQGVIQCP